MEFVTFRKSSGCELYFGSSQGWKLIAANVKSREKTFGKVSEFGVQGSGERIRKRLRVGGLGGKIRNGRGAGGLLSSYRRSLAIPKSNGICRMSNLADYWSVIPE